VTRLTADRGEEESLGLDGVAGDDEGEAGRVHEVGFRSLAVIVSSMSDGPIGDSAGDASVVHASASVSVLGGLIDELGLERREYLVHSGEDVIRELDLGNWVAPSGCHSDGEAYDPLFR
jgi:hypothetical protein